MTAVRVVGYLVVAAFAGSACALEWQAAPGARSASVAVPQGGRPGFARLPASQTAIAFSNGIAVDRYTTNQIYLNGSGVAAGDVDGDGYCDIFFAGLAGQSRFYRNHGNWNFKDATREAGITCERLDASGATFADLEGDSDLDLIVNSVGGGTWIFVNDGKGRFTKHAELNPRKCGASLALSDIDGDGDLDLYIANYRTVTMRDEPNAPFRVNQEGGRTVILEYKGRRVTEPDLEGRFAIGERGQIVENGEADVLYRNDGGGTFHGALIYGRHVSRRGRPTIALASLRLGPLGDDARHERRRRAGYLCVQRLRVAGRNLAQHRERKISRDRTHGGATHQHVFDGRGLCGYRSRRPG